MAPGGPFPWNISVLFCTLSLGFDWTAEDEQRPTRPHVFQRTPAIHPEHTPAPPTHAQHHSSPRRSKCGENGDQTWTQAQQGGPTRPLDQCPCSPASWGTHQPDSRPAQCPTPTLLSLPPPPPAPTLSEAGFLWAIFGAHVAGLRSHSRGQGWTSPVRLPRLLGFWTLG